MKLDPRRVEAFLRDPGKVRVVLLHGEDHGLVRERGSQLVRAVAGSLDDPFDVVELDRDTISSFSAEMMSRSLTGRRRVIRFRDATDVAAEPIRRGLAGGGTAFAVLEAGSLAARSKLRMLMEQEQDAQVIACYPLEGAAAAAQVAAIFVGMSVKADDDAIRLVCDVARGDHALLRSEAEKIAMYVGPGGRASLSDAMRSVGDAGSLSVEDALYAATAGQIARADRALETALAEGATAVGVLRAGVMHVHRLIQARLAVDAGSSASEAAKRLRPPIYFRRVPEFSQAVAAASLTLLDATARHFGDTERACKRTAAPADSLVRNAVMSVARRHAALRRSG